MPRIQPARSCGAATWPPARSSGDRTWAPCWLAAMPPDARASVWTATAELLHALERAGARHPDLNVGNVLIVENGDGSRRALVLDVDRMVFGRANDRRIGAANIARLVRSLRKLRSQRRLTVTDDEMEKLAVLATKRGNQE